jgi:orotidine 5'-phosphate decarboxylase subfamily 2
MTLIQKWHQAAQKKNSILCIGLDPADKNQKHDSPIQDKVQWCTDLITKVAPFAAAIKVNRNYILDLSREQVQQLVNHIQKHGMIAIIDHKLADMGETNDSAFYHMSKEGWDATTYSPYPGNINEAVTQAHKHGIGIIVVTLMSNPEFEHIKNATINNKTMIEFIAFESQKAGADAIVIGAPSDKNHIKEAEIEKLKQLFNGLILMPGIGAQGGDAEKVVKLFGDKVIANVGRAIIYAENPAKEAEKYRDLLLVAQQ